MDTQKQRSTFAMVTAALCVLTALACIFSFVAGSPLQAIDFRNGRIDSVEEQIGSKTAEIISLEENISDYHTEQEAARLSLSNAEAERATAEALLSEANTALEAANIALDAVCTYYYYSTWYCTPECQPLHEDVSIKEAAVDDAKNNALAWGDQIAAARHAITTQENNIADAENKIEETKNNIAGLREDLSQLRKALIKDWMLFFVRLSAIIVGVGGLGLFAKCFYTRTYRKLALIGCSAIVLSSLVFFVLDAIYNPLWQNAPLLYILLCPYSWSVLIQGFFAGNLLKKAQKPQKLRIGILIAAVVMTVLSILSSNAATCLVYIVTMVCAALVLVPIVFTEYNSIPKHLFLSLITFGIWQMFWTYHVTKNLNKATGVEIRRPGASLLLCLFLPFYYTYWLMKTGEYVEAYGRENKKFFKLDILCLVFAFICPLFSTVLIQDKINLIVGKPE